MFDNSLSDSSSSADARLVLAAALATPGLLPALSEVLCAEDFDPDEERPLWLALLALERRGVEIDAQSALRQLARQGNFSALGILPDLEEFVAHPPGGAALDKAVANLRRFSQSRQVVALLEELVEIGLKHHGDAPGAFAAIHARAQEALAVRGVGGAKPLSARRLVEEQSASEDRAWLLDRLLPAGGVSLLAGEVASGKTFLALDLAIAVCCWGRARAPVGRARVPGRARSSTAASTAARAPSAGGCRPCAPGAASPRPITSSSISRPSTWPNPPDRSASWL